MSYRVEITETKNLIVQLGASKSSTKDLFNDPLNEKYQISINVLLKNTRPMEKLDLL